jgi:hypothetical protein
MFRAIDKWLLPYLLRKRIRCESQVHLIISVCDHFEPFHHTDKSGALARIATWDAGFTGIANDFRDSDGLPPRHTFFYPVEQYDDDVVAGIAKICHRTGSEVEVHLHHENDDARSLRALLEQGKRDLSEHGLLKPGGRFAFIHGDWALDNSHPQGLHCGVSGELGILRKAGCYADLTMPSAPSPTQTRTINSIYYATSSDHPKSHDHGEAVGSATSKNRDDLQKLLMVQGPLGPNWGWRKFGLIPRVENGDLTGANPPTLNRLGVWQRIAPRIASRPDVIFVKLHTHGAVERNSNMLLGTPMRRFHQALAASGIPYHYATAREMVNIIHAIEDGKSGSPGEFRNYLIQAPTQ